MLVIKWAELIFAWRVSAGSTNLGWFSFFFFPLEPPRWLILAFRYESQTFFFSHISTRRCDRRFIIHNLHRALGPVLCVVYWWWCWKAHLLKLWASLRYILAPIYPTFYLYYISEGEKKYCLKLQTLVHRLSFKIRFLNTYHLHHLTAPQINLVTSSLGTTGSNCRTAKLIKTSSTSTSYSSKNATHAEQIL